MPTHYAYLTEAERALAERQETTLKNLLKQSKEDRLARIKQIEAENETTAADSYSFLSWGFLVSMLYGVKETFQAYSASLKPWIDFEKLFPGHPGMQEVLPFFGKLFGSAWTAFMQVMSPVALGLSWANAANAWMRLGKTENRTVFGFANAILSTAISVAWTVLFSLGLAGAGAAVAKTVISLPYLLPTVFALFTAHAFFHCVKNSILGIRAFLRNDKQEAKQYAVNALRSLVNVVTNSLALAASVVLGIKFKEATDLIQQDFEAGKKAVIRYWNQTTHLLYAMATFFGVSQIINTTKMNEETLNFLHHPVTSFDKAISIIKAHPQELLRLPISIAKIPFRIVALVAVPFQLAGKWIANKIFTKAPSQPVPQEAPPIDPAVIHDENPQSIKNKIQNLNERIQKEWIKDLDKSYPIEQAPNDIKAKRFHAAELTKLLLNELSPNKKISNYVGVDELEKDSRLLGNYTRSFWGKSRAEKFTEEARELLKQSREERLTVAAPGGA